MTTRNHGRGEGNITMTISLPKALKQRIEAAAAAENRNVSNWFVTHVEKLLDPRFFYHSANENSESTDFLGRENTPVAKTKYQTAAQARAQKKRESAGVKTVKLSESSDSGSSTPTTGGFQQTG